MERFPTGVVNRSVGRALCRRSPAVRVKLAYSCMNMHYQQKHLIFDIRGNAPSTLGYFTSVRKEKFTMANCLYLTFRYRNYLQAKFGYAAIIF